MSLFSALIKVAVETAKLPFFVAADIATLGVRKATDGESYTEKKLDDIKEASEG